VSWWRRGRPQHTHKIKKKEKPDRVPDWIQALAVIGGLALVGVTLTLFFSIGRRPGQMDATEAPAVDSPEFLASISGVAGAPLRSGGTARLLNNGDEFYPALLSAIAHAKRSINFAVYIWEKGPTTDRVLDALAERARAGVEVRVLLDGFGAFMGPKEGLEKLKAAGGKVTTFRPPRFGKLTIFHRRNHRRAIVIDGEVAFTGGMAVAEKWVGHADTEEHWRDSMTEVTGPPALTLQSAFVPSWAFAAGELLVGAKFFPPAPSAAAATGGEPILVHTGLASSPTADQHPLRLFFLQSFRSARSKLYISASYFVPDRPTREAVADRARHGVDVRILLPDEHTDADMIRQTSHKYFEDLLSAGVRVYEYQPTMFHNKTVAVDGRWSVVGSANMDVRSRQWDDDNVLGILDPGFAAQIERSFLADLAKSQEFKLDEWRRRGWWSRLKENVAVLFAEQY
jgi:cardiolipin synthase